MAGVMEIEFEVLDPTSDYIQALEFAVVNNMPFPSPNGRSQVVYPQSYNLNVEHVDATVFGDVRKTFFPVARIVVNAIA